MRGGADAHVLSGVDDWERAESRYAAERYSDQAAFLVCVCMDHSMGMIALQTDFSIDYHVSVFRREVHLGTRSSVSV